MDKFGAAMTELPPRLAPTNLQDTWWIISTVIMIVLMGISAFFLKRLIDEIDSLKKPMTDLMKEQTMTGTRLQDHILNAGVHCKNGNCRQKG